MLCFRNLLSLLAALFIFASCHFDQTFSEFRDFPEKGWNRYDTLIFSPEIKETGKYNLFVDTRNNNKYSYQNVWMFVSCKQDSVVLYSDTLEIKLADKLGNWLGSGWGSLYELTTPLKNSFILNQGKHYTFRIVQGMRDYDLKGMESVGFHIEKAK
jgi:gliding motility-associated lipoprotein GldH